MQQCSVDDLVELTKDIPELELFRGSVGVIRSIWFAPMIAYEIEFKTSGTESHARALVMAENVTLIQGKC